MFLSFKNSSSEKHWRWHISWRKPAILILIFLLVISPANCPQPRTETLNALRMRVLNTTDMQNLWRFWTMSKMKLKCPKTQKSNLLPSIEQCVYGDAFRRHLNKMDQWNLTWLSFEAAISFKLFSLNSQVIEISLLPSSTVWLSLPINDRNKLSQYIKNKNINIFKIKICLGITMRPTWTGNSFINSLHMGTFKHTCLHFINISKHRGLFTEKYH